MKMFNLWNFGIIFAVLAMAQSESVNFVELDSSDLRSFVKSPIEQARIVDGVRAKLGEFPWHASIAVKYVKNAEPSYCSGAILNEQWILATAECITNAKAIRVDVGSIDIYKPLVSVYPEAYIVHPKFDVTKFRNNIALLRLSENKKFNFTTAEGKYSPIRLPQRRQATDSFNGYDSYFSGFGHSTLDSKYPNEYLSFVKQRIITNSDCSVYYKNDTALISSNVICASSVNMRQGVCLGDGGAPLIIKESKTSTLIGLMSFVHKDRFCGGEANPIVFTRITSYFDWIRQITGYQIRP